MSVYNTTFGLFTCLVKPAFANEAGEKVQHPTAGQRGVIKCSVINAKESMIIIWFKDGVRISKGLFCMRMFIHYMLPGKVDISRYACGLENIDL